MAKLLRLDVAQLTDVGRKREHNEDNMAYVIPKDPLAMIHKGALFIVADGMGGHAAGEVASEIAVDTVSNAYYQNDNEDVPGTLLQAIRRANAAIHQRAAENMLRSGMGTTCVAAVLRGNVAYIANVGDSRAYLIRKGQIRQVSQDHSWVAEQVRAGLLTEDQARTHAQRNVITRSLGTQTEVEIDIFREVLEEGDILVLCSDGLSGFITEEDLQRTVEQFVPQESVYHLVEHANENGGGDNITAIVARVDELGTDPPVRQPVPMGGPEISNEDTARLFAPIGSAIGNLPARNGEIPVPGSPFPYNTSSGPLTLSPSSPTTSESVTGSQPALRGKKRRGRLFYPTIALVALFLLAAVGSGAYYFIHARQAQTITQTLAGASQDISQAQGQLSSNPALALQNLAHAQQQLESLQSDVLNASDASRLTTLQTQLVNATKTAITNYNTAARISSVPCPGATPSNVSSGNTGTTAQSMAVIKGGGSVLYYGLGQDGKIYLLSSTSTQFVLTSPLAASVQFTSFVGSNSSNADGKIFALSTQTSNNTTSYAVNLLAPGSQGALNVAKSSSISAPLLTNGTIPTLITAWGNDVYVVLSSKGNPNTITILSYNVDDQNGFGTPKQTQSIAVNAGVVAIAAFPGQLFLLLADGQLLSSQIHPADLSLSTPPASVLINSPIATPLSAGAQDFKATTNVPSATPTQQTGSGPLTIPASSNSLVTMSAGQIQADSQPHLFIGDPANHRVLDLVVPVPASSGGPAGATPTATSSTLSNSVTLNLIQQYVSLSFFAGIKSVAVTPAGSNINILGQSTHSENLVTVNSGPQQACAA